MLGTATLCSGQGAQEQHLWTLLPVAYRALGRQDADGALLHLHLKQVGDQHTFVKPTAAAKTRATPAAVLFCLVKVECFGWLIASPKPPPLGVLELSVGAYMRK